MGAPSTALEPYPEAAAAAPQVAGGLPPVGATTVPGEGEIGASYRIAELGRPQLQHIRHLGDPGTVLEASSVAADEPCVVVGPSPVGAEPVPAKGQVGASCRPSKLSRPQSQKIRPLRRAGKDLEPL